jgi:translation initiation factor 2B subunit (eIF-2B alpha/beta/delta family)
MEEKSLPLIEKSQYICETLDQIQLSISQTVAEENHQVEKLQLKINQLEELIKYEIQREISCQNLLMYLSLIKKLFLLINYYLSREYKNSKDDPFIEQIKKSIEILYKKYIISDDIGISTIHMLQTIENKIKYLFNLIENMNPLFIIEAEKVFKNKYFFFIIYYYFSHVK